MGEKISRLRGERIINHSFNSKQKKKKNHTTAEVTKVRIRNKLKASVIDNKKKRRVLWTNKSASRNTPAAVVVK